MSPSTLISYERKTLEYRINAELSRNHIFVDKLVKTKILEYSGYVLVKSAVFNPYNDKMAALYITIERRE